MTALVELPPGICLPPAYFSAAGAARAKAHFTDGGLRMIAVFLESYLTAYPRERGRSLSVAISDQFGSSRRHEIGLFSYVDRLWIFDPHRGVIATGIPARSFALSEQDQALSKLCAACIRDDCRAGQFSPDALPRWFGHRSRQRALRSVRRGFSPETVLLQQLGSPSRRSA
jgi:hypothetical protein